MSRQNYFGPTDQQQRQQAPAAVAAAAAAGGYVHQEELLKDCKDQQMLLRGGVKLCDYPHDYDGYKFLLYQNEKA